MPLTRISILKGKPPAHRTALMEGVYAAMRETFAVPEDDRFMMVHEHEPADFAYGAGYLGIARSDDLAIIQITCTGSRDAATKQALYRAIVANLARDPRFAAGGRLHQPRRGEGRELVLRPRPGAICRAGLSRARNRPPLWLSRTGVR